MAIWEHKKVCKVCHNVVDIFCTKCPYCGNDNILSFQSNYDSSTTTISGEQFTISSATAVMPSFTHIAERYDNDVNAEIPETNFLIPTQPAEKKVETKDIEYYISLGYLIRLPSSRLKLTELGKQAYNKNKEFRDKIQDVAGNVEI